MQFYFQVFWLHYKDVYVSLILQYHSWQRCLQTIGLPGKKCLFFISHSKVELREVRTAFTICLCPTFFALQLLIQIQSKSKGDGRRRWWVRTEFVKLQLLQRVLNLTSGSILVLAKRWQTHIVTFNQCLINNNFIFVPVFVFLLILQYCGLNFNIISVAVQKYGLITYKQRFHFGIC